MRPASASLILEGEAAEAISVQSSTTRLAEPANSGASPVLGLRSPWVDPDTKRREGPLRRSRFQMTKEII
jgi:hypothetical protein